MGSLLGCPPRPFRARLGLLRSGGAIAGMLATPRDQIRLKFPIKGQAQRARWSVNSIAHIHCSAISIT